MDQAAGFVSRMTPWSLAGSLLAGGFFYFVVRAKTGRRPHSLLAMLLCLGSGTGLVCGSDGSGRNSGSDLLGVGLLVAAMGVFIVRDGWAVTMEDPTGAPAGAPPKDPAA